MRNIFKIFGRDVKSLIRHFFAFVVAIAIMILPSLYAWLNIYSNWDPYGNTGNISIAVASMDKGYVTDTGEKVNKGDDIIEDLRESTAINWVITDSEEQAVNGVYSGEYYAAVVIDEDFSYNMFNMLTEWTGKPSITYYENAKKNAVATKITDTAAESVKTSINEAYLEVVINTVMESANRIAEDIESDDPSGTFHGIIKQAITTLKAADQTMAAFSAATSGIPQNSLDTQKLDEILMQMEENMPTAADINATVAEINMNINEINARLEEALRILQDSNSSGGAVANAQQVVTDSADSLAEMSDMLSAMADTLLPGSQYKEPLEKMSAAAGETSKWLRMLAEQEILAGTVENVSASLETLIALNSSFIPCVEDIGRELSATFLNVADLLESSKIMLSDAAVLKEAAAQTKADANEVVNILKPAGKRVTDPSVKAIIDIGGQDVKGISIDTDGTVKNFAMNDKCAAGTGRFFEAMARSFELSLPEFSKLSLTAKNVIPITAQCTVFAESEVITLVGEGKPMDEIAAGIEMAVAKRCFVMAKKAGATDSITLTGGCAKNDGLKEAIEHVLKLKVVNLKTDPQLMGALGAAEYARQKGLAKK